MNKVLSLRKNIGTFKAQAKAGELELYVYDVIGADMFGEGITAASFTSAITDAGDISKITVRVNSPGGDAFEGLAIFNVLRGVGKPVNVLVDGLAASAASIVAMAGDTITMGEGSLMMIHNALCIAFGNAADMRKSADVLDTVSGSIADVYAN